MSNNVLRDKSFEFSVDIVRLCKQLFREKEYIISKQLFRSGTSIGANIEEANGAYSKKDFANKISISYKEARESNYWLRLLKETDYIDENTFARLKNDLSEIIRIQYSILKRVNPSNQ